MNDQVAADCARAHELVWKLPVHSFSFDKARIPKNGLYVLLERGEESHGGPRIVQVGTHTGANQLPARLSEHFVNENKDRSILRKHIGRCLLTRADDAYLAIWEVDATTRAARLALPPEYDQERQAAIERAVSEYMRSAFSFVVVEVAEKADRLRLKAGLVSLVASCTTCLPSPTWLGLHSPKERIRLSGLWQVNELYKEPIDALELQDLLGGGA